MSSIFPTTTVKTDDSDALDINSGDYVYVETNVQLVAQGLGDGISDTGYAWIDIHGSVIGELGLSISGDATNVTSITVAAGGDVSGTVYGAMDVGGLHQIVNFGTIESASPIEVGVYTWGAGTIDNYSDISAYSAVDDSDNVATDVSTLYNSGTIAGIKYSFVSGSEFGGAADKDKEIVTNAGRMVGAVYMSNGGDTLRNSGSIEGDIQLGNGTNTFNGVGGTVDGTITGGKGADTIHLGNDGETVNGGLGHDVIYGGTGADTFVFISDGAANADGIRNFNVANDIIELSHATFTKLAVGQTPVFSIGAGATSASDHLYYNSTGGGLWYDPDGSGSQAAVAIANLGPGLKLTAKDFTIF